jgi:D-aminoacyl-tRNA deacylase
LGFDRIALFSSPARLSVIAVLQRVSQARVEVEGRVIGRIGRGLLLFVCAEPDDTDTIADKLVDKVLRLRIFGDAAGKMNLDLSAVSGGLLVISQFTLAADTASGNRPGFSRAAGPDLGRRIYERVLTTATARHGDVAHGEFGADMKVHLVNDGPVTIPLTLRAPG